MAKKGFTLVELLVAVGILMILLLLVVPNLWRARINSNESVAVSNLKSLNSALQMYYINNDYFPEDLTKLIPPESDPGYIDPNLTDGSAAGYTLEYNFEGEDTFYINAGPRRPGRTGNRCFYIDETGEVRYQERDNCPAGSDSPILR